MSLRRSSIDLTCTRERLKDDFVAGAIPNCHNTAIQRNFVLPHTNTECAIQLQRGPRQSRKERATSVALLYFPPAATVPATRSPCDDLRHPPKPPTPFHPPHQLDSRAKPPSPWRNSCVLRSSARPSRSRAGASQEPEGNATEASAHQESRCARTDTRLDIRTCNPWAWEPLGLYGAYLGTTAKVPGPDH